MKSFISFALLLSVSFLSAGTAGERIAVPLRWERIRTAESCQFEKKDAAEDSGNYVFAFTVAGLPELTAEKGSISVYWNCDGDKMTGRFGKSFGADIQFNIRLSDQSVNAILWKNEKERSALSLPRENLHLAVNGNTVLMVLRAKALRKLRISDRSKLRVMRRIRGNGGTVLIWKLISGNAVDPSWRHSSATAPCVMLLLLFLRLRRERGFRFRSAGAGRKMYVPGSSAPSVSHRIRANTFSVSRGGNRPAAAS